MPESSPNANCTFSFGERNSGTSIPNVEYTKRGSDLYFADDGPEPSQGPNPLFGTPPSGVSRFSLFGQPVVPSAAYLRTLRTVKVRVLNRSGSRLRLHPILSLQFARLLNRTFGVIFRSEGPGFPTEVRSLFQIGKQISIEI